MPSDTLHFKVERAVRYFAPDAKETLRTSTIQQTYEMSCSFPILKVFHSPAVRTEIAERSFYCHAYIAFSDLFR